MNNRNTSRPTMLLQSGKCLNNSKHLPIRLRSGTFLEPVFFVLQKQPIKRRKNKLCHVPAKKVRWENIVKFPQKVALISAVRDLTEEEMDDLFIVRPDLYDTE